MLRCLSIIFTLMTFINIKTPLRNILTNFEGKGAPRFSVITSFGVVQFFLFHVILFAIA